MTVHLYIDDMVVLLSQNLFIELIESNIWTKKNSQYPQFYQIAFDCFLLLSIVYFLITVSVVKK